jgi:integrase
VAFHRERVKSNDYHYQRPQAPSTPEARADRQGPGRAGGRQPDAVRPPHRGRQALVLLDRPSGVGLRQGLPLRDPEGRKCQKDDPGAQKVRIVSKVWYGRYKDAAGNTRTVALSPDKKSSKEQLAKLVSDAKTKQLYPEPELTPAERKIQEQGKRPLGEHLEDYRHSLQARGRCAEHVAKTCGQAQTVIDGCGFTLIAHLDGNAVVEFLAGLQAPAEAVKLPDGQEEFTAKQVAALLGVKPEAVGRMARRRLVPCKGAGRERVFHREAVAALAQEHGQGIGIATSNHYLAAVKGFAKWLVKEGRAALNPLGHLSRQNAKVDVRRQRRPLAAAEFTKLIDAATKGQPFRRLAGEDRAWLYTLAAATGFRANELASLTPASFSLDGDPPTVTVEAGYSKHRRQDVQTIRKDVAGLFRAYLAGRPPGQPIWPGTWSDNAAEMLRLDLEAAGIPYRDTAGRVFDFHGTRHTFISRLAESGVHPKMAQILARHSTITLTMDYYTQLGLHDQTAALDKLPPLPTPKKAQPPQGETGAA